ncbi:MAG: hypothetical protein AAFP00_18030, partial [Bacteroidota bacterium]
FLIQKDKEEIMPTSELLRLFQENEEVGNTNRKLNDVMVFAKECCKDVEEVIKLLEEASFTISRLKPDDPQVNIHWKNNEHNYTEFISASRLSTLSTISPFKSEYRIVLYIRDGRIHDSWAKIIHTSL